MLELILNDFDLKKIAYSGQCFRINEIYNNTFEIIAHNKKLIVDFLGDACYRFYCNEDDFNDVWYDYFNLGECYDDYANSINDNDSFLKNAYNFSRGLKILKQDPWEMIVSFIISQRKNIASIKNCIETLCRSYGEQIDEVAYAFPTAERLSSLTEDELKKCSLGYRAIYILNTAKMVANKDINLDTLNKLNDEDLMCELQKLPGVGKKVASCIMLFSFYRIDSFPIDVWIERIIQKEYPKGFPFEKYKGFSGIMQQYMFYYVQNNDEYKQNFK